MTDTLQQSLPRGARQGVANIATGFLGGMAGCAMIGQVNDQRVAPADAAGLRRSWPDSGLLILVVVAAGPGGRIPMPALVAVMIMVSVSTFNWGSVINLRTYPRQLQRMVMLATVAVVLYTHNLAYGVLVGVLLSGVFFAAKISQIMRCALEPVSRWPGAHLHRDRAGLLRVQRGVRSSLRPA